MQKQNFRSMQGAFQSSLSLRIQSEMAIKGLESDQVALRIGMTAAKFDAALNGTADFTMEAIFKLQTVLGCQLISVAKRKTFVSKETSVDGVPLDSIIC